MNGNVLRLKGKRFQKRSAKAFKRIRRKTGNEIHVDIFKAVFPCHMHCLFGHCRGMAAADCLKNAVGKCLRINADASGAAVFDNFKLFIVNAVRSARFNSIFAVFRNIKIIRNAIGQFFKKCG